MTVDTTSKYRNLRFGIFGAAHCAVVFLIISFSQVVCAQSEPSLALHPYLNNDSLKLELRYDNLFSGNIKKTLLAGLPILLELNLHLLDSQNQTLHSGNLSGKIIYDVWEELFEIEGFEAMKSPLQSLDELHQYFATQVKTALLPGEYLMPGEVYRVNAESRLTLLTRKQSRELQDWIQSSDQTEEDLPSQERDTGFRLNLNNLVQFFMGNQDKPERYVLQASTDPFRLNDLSE